MGIIFCHLVLVIQHFQAIARWRVHVRYKGFPRVKDYVSENEKGSCISFELILYLEYTLIN